MSNSRRWRLFMEWWSKKRIELKDTVYASPVIHAIDDKIEEIKRNDKGELCDGRR